ncbi:MAG: glutamate synthase subunit alpha, partial [Myxococcota bacterium]
MTHPPRPKRQGLYDPEFEHDACGVGFVCHLDGHKTHDIIERGLEILVNLTHRGAVGADPDTGDGAGILIQMPHRFLERVAHDLHIRLPEPGDYGVGMTFLPADPSRLDRSVEVVEGLIAEEGQAVLGWREVPVDPDVIGEGARRGMPVIRQVFVGRSREVEAGDAFERKLYVIRKRIEGVLREEATDEFHIPSFSARTLNYKGLLLAPQIERFYADLTDSTLESALALVHQRYSTNTWPTWD